MVLNKQPLLTVSAPRVNLLHHGFRVKKKKSVCACGHVQIRPLRRTPLHYTQKCYRLNTKACVLFLAGIHPPSSHSSPFTSHLPEKNGWQQRSTQLQSVCTLNVSAATGKIHIGTWECNAAHRNWERRHFRATRKWGVGVEETTTHPSQHGHLRIHLLLASS